MCVSKDHRGCVVAAYGERIAIMEALLALRVRPPPLDVTCGAQLRRVIWHRTDRGVEATVLAEMDGAFAGVALPESTTSGWQVFLSAHLGGRRLTLMPGSERVDCAVSTRLANVSDADLRAQVDTIDSLLASAKAARARGSRLKFPTPVTQEVERIEGARRRRLPTK